MSVAFQGAVTAASEREENEKQLYAEDAEARSVQLQPIKDHRTQRIKNKLLHCLNKAVRQNTSYYTPFKW